MTDPGTGNGALRDELASSGPVGEPADVALAGRVPLTSDRRAERTDVERNP